VRVGELVGGLLLAAFGVYAAVVAWGYDIGRLSEPGAGFFPFFSAVLMVGCALYVAFRSVSLRTANGDGDKAPTAAAPNVKLVIAIVVLTAYAGALPLVGFVITTFLAMFALAALDDETSWASAAVIAAVSAVLFWLIFVVALDVSFPPPLIGF
jgi:putative tricarboxylic transport membrane protein